MKPMQILALIAILCLSSCGSLTKRTINSVETVRTLQKQELVVAKKLDKNTSVYIDGALKALKKAPASTPETKLAMRLLEDAQEITGIPEHSIRLDVDLLTIANGAEVKKLEDLEKEHRATIQQREKLEEQVAVLHKQIEEDAINLAVKYDVPWYQKVKDWIFGYISIIAIIACALIFGPKLVSFIWKRFFI